MSDFRQVAPDFWLSPQLAATDFAEAAALGVKSVINNRPDGEAQDQLSSAQAQALATAAGLAYHHIPFVSGRMGMAEVEAMREVLAAGNGPWLAYCRSGTRSCQIWALSTATERPVEATIEAAAAAGYDLTGLTPILRNLAG